MQIWGVVNQKGGVGKTTTTVAIGGILAKQGQRVLMLDLDPQGSLTRYFGLSADDSDNTTASLFDEPSAVQIINSVRPTGEPDLSLIPGSAALSALERKKASTGGMGMAIARALRLIATEFDYVLLDSPPVLGLLMVNVLAASDRLMLPSQTEPLALEGLERMVRTLEMVKKSRGSAPPHLIVPTLHDKRTRAGKDCLNELRRRYPDSLWRGAVPVDTLLREASRQQISPAQINESSRGLDAYEQLLRDIAAGTECVETPDKPGAWMAV
ncbi:AAA family ATPase [Litorivicinus lipolyticus]|uniref:AAA family ATPase n=1 Tax=Litorivicinus lipolyticus TaxID=418701 RepID=A0A5Q2QD62_9GAMM|nr:ParA family protein [Litorivicinus lipolyticus]QGG80262.1 AAA family ATPase [Litorivicinus lipolyticus]